MATSVRGAAAGGAPLSQRRETLAFIEVAAPTAAPRAPDFVVLDFAQVQGINETAAALLCKYARSCAEADVTLLYASMSPDDSALLRAYSDESVPIRLLANTRDAVEVCEELILAGASQIAGGAPQKMGLGGDKAPPSPPAATQPTGLSLQSKRSVRFLERGA